MRRIHALAAIMLWAATLPAAEPAPAPAGAPALAYPVPEDAPVIASYGFRINYSVAATPSNRPVKVEFYMTSDMGKTWTLHGEDPDLQSPMNVRVNQDGVYGFVSVATDSRGNREREPVPAPRREAVAAVDRRPPTAQWVKPEAGAGNLVQPEAVEFEWIAEDDNLDQGPVSLEASYDGRQTWNAFAADLPAAGSHAWRPSGRAGTIHFRLVVRDRAGNTLQLRCPVTATIDNTPPGVRITGPAESGGLEVPVAYSASDEAGGTGLMDVTLYASYDNGISWRKSAVSPSVGAPIPFTAEQPGRIGLVAVARDRAYNASPLPYPGIPPFWLQIDTEPPAVTVHDFLHGLDYMRPGENRYVSWYSTDASAVPNGASVHLSRDGGRTWELVAGNQMSNGGMQVLFPGSDTGECRVKVEVVDRFGNRGQGLSAPFRIESDQFTVRNVRPLEDGSAVPVVDLNVPEEGDGLVPVDPAGTRPGGPALPQPTSLDGLVPVGGLNEDDSAASVFPSTMVERVQQGGGSAGAGDGDDWTKIFGQPETGEPKPPTPASAIAGPGATPEPVGIPSGLPDPSEGASPIGAPVIPGLDLPPLPDISGAGAPSGANLPPGLAGIPDVPPMPGVNVASPATAASTPPAPGGRLIPPPPSGLPGTATADTRPGSAAGGSISGMYSSAPQSSVAQPPSAARLEQLQGMAIDPRQAGEAVRELSAMALASPGNFHVQAALATAYHTNKDYVRAAAVAETALQLNQQYWFAHLLLGNIYCSHAEELARRVQQATEGNLPAEAAGLADERDRLAALARNELLLARDFNAADKHVHLRLGDVAFLEAQVAQEREQDTYLRSVGGAAAADEATLRRAKAYALDNSRAKYEEAARHYLAAHNIAPIGYHETFALGRINFLLQNFVEARKYFMEAIDNSVNNLGMPVQTGEAHHMLGLTYGSLNDYALALRHLEQARREYPENHPALPLLETAIRGVERLIAQ